MILPSPALQLYYITDRRSLPAPPLAGAAAGPASPNPSSNPASDLPDPACSALLDRIAACAAAGVDYIQLRERDLTARQLERLADAAGRLLAAIPPTPGRPASRLLINSRVDIAIAVGAHGVHLRANQHDVSASDARVIFDHAGVSRPIIAVSCHSLADVALAESHGADFAVLGPVFEKEKASPLGLDLLYHACHRIRAAQPPMPVFALGGVTRDNAALCAEAGAGGIAAIRLFQDADAARTISLLRASLP